MKKSRIENFSNGWFVGNFKPSIFQSNKFELGVKLLKEGEKEPSHYQKTAYEITYVVSGQCILNEQLLLKGDVLLVEPEEIGSFEAITDCILVVAKTPSMPDDKYLVLGDDIG